MSSRISRSSLDPPQNKKKNPSTTSARRVVRYLVERHTTTAGCVFVRVVLRLSESAHTLAPIFFFIGKKKNPEFKKKRGRNLIKTAIML